MASEIAKRIILEELGEQAHPEAVEDVIFWALEAYAIAKKDECTFGGIIANAIVQRIKDEESIQPSGWQIEIMESKACPKCSDSGKLDDNSICPCHY